MIDYTLAVLTHGDSRTLGQTLSSFMDKVKPAPVRILVHFDGGSDISLPVTERRVERFIDSRQRGFCQATARLWRWASTPGDGVPPYVFWLEHDFTFLRPVDLGALASVLDSDKQLVQMQLMRNAVSHEEIAAGGLYQMREAEYEPRWGNPTPDDEWAPAWLAHRSYFSTNPSLLRSDFMAWNQWPDDAPECEGRFGIDLVRRGFYFGVWGSGEPWCEHIGIRDGIGKGY